MLKDAPPPHDGPAREGKEEGEKMTSILLFGLETWVVAKPMLQALEGFHHRVVCRIAGKQPYFCRETDEWIYPPIEKALEEVGLWPIKKYNTVADTMWPHGLFSNYVPKQSCQPDPNLAEEGGIRLTKILRAKSRQQNFISGQFYIMTRA
eukprot:scaffold88095_cov64-Attheya_sp.AAC.2